MKYRFPFVPLVACFLAMAYCVSAQAHFVWVALSASDRTASLFFGEGPEPSEADLLDRVAQAKVFARDSEGKYLPLKLEKKVSGSQGSWIAAEDGNAWKGLEAVCDYGVLTKRERPFWLKYYAKYLDRSALKNQVLCQSEKLPLDIIPIPQGDGIALQVTMEGKPVEGAEVVITDDAYEQQKLTTDANGKVLLKDPKPDTYCVRAKWVEEKPGEHDGKQYESIRHYSTVALNLSTDQT
ncbi:DUF4198 domain-containing protein [Blastopirellula marina]|uniref:DUF4198 domain-containing protein n=1 Tax=Blastopirellula marina TaxID=124 RepID=A0A2S8F4M7_9BACT|nr:DUF4198 domain-containing protein [Blastopirellula marina]PQO27103.1 hypothetical protein C5Y98_28035 [Blastopirellula marina]PTL41250.1 DUF4198 domain-containing protein [Blastopirellula marina]